MNVHAQLMPLADSEIRFPVNSFAAQIAVPYLIDVPDPSFFGSTHHVITLL